MNQIDKEHRRTFESIRRQTEDGKECWSARDLARVLGYSEYRHFEPVIIRSKNACRNSGHPVSDYYNEIGHGFFEAIYQGALKNESQLQNIPYAKEKRISVYYRKKTLNVSFGTTQLQYKRFVFNLRESADT